MLMNVRLGQKRTVFAVRFYVCFSPKADISAPWNGGGNL